MEENEIEICDDHIKDEEYCHDEVVTDNNIVSCCNKNSDCMEIMTNSSNEQKLWEKKECKPKRNIDDPQTDTEEDSILECETKIEIDNSIIQIVDINEIKTRITENGNITNDNKIDGSTRSKCVYCKDCDTYCASSKELVLHKRRYHPEKCKQSIIYECSDCTYKTVRKLDLQNHRQIQHGNADVGKIHKCPHCDYTGLVKFYFDKHMFKKHNSQSPQKLCCDSCDFSTFSQKALQKHTKTHDRIHSCPYCEQDFKTRNALEIHEVRQHPDKCGGKIIYECKDCSYCSTTKGTFKTHRLTHEDVDKRPKWNCTKCSYTSRNKNNLYKHMLRHLKTEKRDV